MFQNTVCITFQNLNVVGYSISTAKSQIIVFHGTENVKLRMREIVNSQQIIALKKLYASLIGSVKQFISKIYAFKIIYNV
jgi:hypothetical protein